jgi:hypothetical protein
MGCSVGLNPSGREKLLIEPMLFALACIFFGWKSMLPLFLPTPVGNIPSTALLLRRRRERLKLSAITCFPTCFVLAFCCVSFFVEYA